jgi:hypothetical protein
LIGRLTPTESKKHQADHAGTRSPPADLCCSIRADGRLGSITEFANMALDQTELAQIVSAVIQALKVGDTASKAPAISASAPVDKLAMRHAAILKGFQRKGFKDAKLFVDIKPFKSWMSEGKIVKKGQKSIKGLFHRDQTEVIKPPAKAQPVPAEQKTLFEQAKKALKAKKARATQPVA